MKFLLFFLSLLSFFPLLAAESESSNEYEEWSQEIKNNPIYLTNFVKSLPKKYQQKEYKIKVPKKPLGGYRNKGIIFLKSQSDHKHFVVKIVNYQGKNIELANFINLQPHVERYHALRRNEQDKNSYPKIAKFVGYKKEIVDENNFFYSFIFKKAKGIRFFDFFMDFVEGNDSIEFITEDLRIIANAIARYHIKNCLYNKEKCIFEKQDQSSNPIGVHGDLYLSNLFYDEHSGLVTFIDYNTMDFPIEYEKDILALFVFIVKRVKKEWAGKNSKIEKVELFTTTFKQHYVNYMEQRGYPINFSETTQ